jgi:1-acyl-sn-glycerol-3-phosphate acyltransferase
MGFKNIEKKSLGYRLLYIWVKFWHNIVFYRKVVVLNRENIPKNANVIFTPNHQNALMDATALLFTIPRQLIFMARADIFKKPPIAAILYFLKILPIYRSRDGKSSIKKNEKIFERTVDVLTAGNGLVILPEGSHAGVHYLRPLKKGFARIAFQTEEFNNFSLDIKIVPIGVDYTNYQDFRTSLLVNFGSPLSVSDYYTQYKETPALAMNDLKDALAEKMKALIVNIESREYYELYDELKDIYNHRMRRKMGFEKWTHPNKFNADREFVRLLSQFENKHPEEMPALQERVKSFSAKRKRFGFSNEMLAGEKASVAKLLLKTVWLAITLPLFVYGFLNNILPFGITIWAGSKIKDPQFKSSFKFVVSLLVFPLFYILQTVLVAFLAGGPDWLCWAYFISLPVFAAVAWLWNSAFVRLKKQWGFFRLSKKKPAGFTKMLADYRWIIEKADAIVSAS